MKFKTRKREVRYFVDEVDMDGYWFGLEDLIDTLVAVKEDDIFVTNRPMVDALVKRKVIKDGGSRRCMRGAEPGRRYYKFLACMKAYKEEMTTGEEENKGRML